MWQGGVLSAFLFCINVLEINNMNIQAYAEDILLLSPSSFGVRKLLCLAANLIEEADLILHVRKTVVMVFRSKLAVSDDNLNIVLNNELSNVVTTVKCLGCILSKNLNDFLDIERCSTAFNKSAGFLLRKFYY